jgi:hypothetical protein
MFNMSDFSNVSSPDSLGSEKGMGAQDDKHSEPNGRTQASEPAQLTQPPQVNEPALTRYPPNQNPTTPTRRPAAQESPQFMRRDPYSTPETHLYKTITNTLQSPAALLIQNHQKHRRSQHPGKNASPGQCRAARKIRRRHRSAAQPHQGCAVDERRVRGRFAWTPASVE